jgi:hypothetical protein
MSSQNGTQFHSAGRIGQIVDFCNLPVGATDIDGMIEYHNRLFVFIEAKVKGAQLSKGQELAYTRLVDSITQRHSILLVAEHETPIQDRVDLGNAAVSKYYYRGKWRIVEPPQMTVARAVELAIKLWG